MIWLGRSFKLLRRDRGPSKWGGISFQLCRRDRGLFLLVRDRRLPMPRLNRFRRLPDGDSAETRLQPEKRLLLEQGLSGVSSLL